MTTIAQKVLNFVESPIGSLEWGSHRKELGLQKHIFSEENVGNPAMLRIRDPITLRTRVVSLPGPVVYGLSDVTFHPGLGIIRASGIPIHESLPYYYDGPFLRGPKPFSFKQGLGLDATALTLQTNYYHFLLEDLPRLLLLRREKGITKVYSGRVRVPGFVREALDMIGIQIIFVDRAVRLQNLWFVARPGDGLGPTQWAVTLLRESLGLEDKPGRIKMYVSRRKSQRNFFDEPRLEKALENLGFETVCFESMTFVQQVEAVAGASMLVGPHGAGLANQVFMARGSSVLEISSDLYANPVFETLAGERLAFERIVVKSGDQGSRDIEEEALATIARLTKDSGKSPEPHAGE